MFRRRKAILIGLPLVLAAICAAFAFLRPIRISTSVDELIGADELGLPEVIREQSSCLVPVIVSSGSAARAYAGAEAFHGKLQERHGCVSVADDCEEIRFRSDGAALNAALDFFFSRRSGLVAPAVVEKLKTSEGRASIARAALRRYYSSPVPPLFAAESDPFCLADGFVKSLPQSVAGWQAKEGLLTAERDGETHVLVLLTLRRETVSSIDRLVSFRTRLDEAVAAAQSGDVQIRPCGAPLHTAISAAACRREIGLLTWFSLAFIVLLSVVVFRGIRWIPLLGLSLGVSVTAGIGAVVAAFGGFHLLTLVMGTTVLGLVVDYSFHWLLHEEEHQAETSRNLVVSFLTTEVSLVPLVLSSIPVLRESAVFLGVGLAAALAYVILGYPQARQVSRMLDPATARWVSAGTVLILIVSLVGLCRLRFGTELTALYRAPTELQASERLFATIGGGNEGRSGFLVTEGGGLENLLAAEDSVGLAEDVPRLSRFLPSLARRRAIYADVLKLYAEHGTRQAEALGLGALVPPREPCEWNVAELPADMRRAFVLGNGNHLSLLVRSVAAPTTALPRGVRFWSPREKLESVLSTWTDEMLVRLTISLALMFFVLLVCCRRQAVVIFLPSLMALAVVCGALGLAGVKVNLFHLLAGFLLAGMSVDYTVFLHGGRAFQPAACSVLTSIAGFGALVFVSFPVVQSFGFVLGLGLPVAFAAALATRPRPETVEKAAFPLGMEILFVLYRLLGLRALHWGAAAVGVCVWACSPRIRRASPSLRKVVFFTRSLADKLVVMAEGSQLPVVRTDGSADAEAFLADVRKGRGVFVLSSHCGTVEVLVAIGACTATFHAWMDFDRTSVFNAFYLRHARRRRVEIHPISEIGLETAFFAGDALERGDSLVMAGDRGRGAFRFAHALEAPVYFVSCVAVGPIEYNAIVRCLPKETKAMEKAYGRALAEVTAAYPDQWFEWTIQSKGELR